MESKVDDTSTLPKLSPASITNDESTSIPICNQVIKTGDGTRNVNVAQESNSLEANLQRDTATSISPLQNMELHQNPVTTIGSVPDNQIRAVMFRDQNEAVRNEQRSLTATSPLQNECHDEVPHLPECADNENSANVVNTCIQAGMVESRDEELLQYSQNDRFDVTSQCNRFKRALFEDSRLKSPSIVILSPFKEEGGSLVENSTEQDLTIEFCDERTSEKKDLHENEKQHDTIIVSKKVSDEKNHRFVNTTSKDVIDLIIDEDSDPFGALDEKKSDNLFNSAEPVMFSGHTVPLNAGKLINTSIDTSRNDTFSSLVANSTSPTFKKKVYGSSAQGSSSVPKAVAAAITGTSSFPSSPPHYFVNEEVKMNGGEKSITFKPRPNGEMFSGEIRLSRPGSFMHLAAMEQTYTLGSHGRRRMFLRLQEETRKVLTKSSQGILGHIRRRSSRIIYGVDDSNNFDIADLKSNGDKFGSRAVQFVERGSITVSWFDGTTSLELQEHVRQSVLRKLRLEKQMEVTDIRVLDNTFDPPEEIVLSPFIPDGSHFLLQFLLVDNAKGGRSSPSSVFSGRAPESPSAAPSPYPHSGIMNPNEITMLRNRLNSLRAPLHKRISSEGRPASHLDKGFQLNRKNSFLKKDSKTDTLIGSEEKTESEDDGSTKTAEVQPSILVDGEEEKEDDMVFHSEDPIEAGLREITNLLITSRQQRRHSFQNQDKRQVIFVLANYFVLFLSLIAISAEIHARAPGWLSSLEAHMKNVQNCAANQGALFECISNGDFAGLIASILLWVSRSVATRRTFLFGFDTPKKLWTVVYECLVTSFCWGFSYLFIRRGLNADTRHRFLQKYWKDAVYGSMAGFNAAFMKQVLKNLIPQEAVEDVLRERQLKILSWLPSFH